MMAITTSSSISVKPRSRSGREEGKGMRNPLAGARRQPELVWETTERSTRGRREATGKFSGHQGQPRTIGRDRPAMTDPHHPQDKPRDGGGWLLRSADSRRWRRWGEQDPLERVIPGRCKLRGRRPFGTLRCGLRQESPAELQEHARQPATLHHAVEQHNAPGRPLVVRRFRIRPLRCTSPVLAGGLLLAAGAGLFCLAAFWRRRRFPVIGPGFQGSGHGQPMLDDERNPFRPGGAAAALPALIRRLAPARAMHAGEGNREVFAVDHSSRRRAHAHRKRKLQQSQPHEKQAGNDPA